MSRLTKFILCLGVCVLLVTWILTWRKSLSYCGSEYGIFIIDGGFDWADLNWITDRSLPVGFAFENLDADIDPPHSRLPIPPLLLSLAVPLLIAFLPFGVLSRIVKNHPWLCRSSPTLIFMVISLSLWVLGQFRYASFATPYASIVLNFGDALVYYDKVTHRLQNEIGPFPFGWGRLPVRGCICCERAIYATWGKRDFSFSLAWIWAPAFGLLMCQRWLRKLTVKLNLCTQCGYDLRSLTSDRCPECGRKPVAQT